MARLTGNEQAEQYLADQVKTLTDDTVSPEDIVMQEVKDQDAPANSAEALNLDDLDSVLNFETKAFSDLVSTMNDVLALNKEEIIPTNDEPLQESQIAVQASGKDQRLSKEFLQKSLTAVEASLTRYVNALISNQNGISTSAIVSQLQIYTATGGAA